MQPASPAGTALVIGAGPCAPFYCRSARRVKATTFWDRSPFFWEKKVVKFFLYLQCDRIREMSTNGMIAMLCHRFFLWMQSSSNVRG